MLKDALKRYIQLSESDISHYTIEDFNSKEKYNIVTHRTLYNEDKCDTTAIQWGDREESKAKNILYHIWLKEHPIWMLLWLWWSGLQIPPTCLGLLAPVLLRLADVGLVADLGHALGLGEEFLGLVGVGLLDGEVTDLAEQERTEQREQSQACLGYAESRRTKTKSSRGSWPSWVPCCPKRTGSCLPRWGRGWSATGASNRIQRPSSPRPGSCPYRPWPSDCGSCVPLVARVCANFQILHRKNRTF